MIPISTKETNVIIGENQPGYEPLPATRLDDEKRSIITTWSLSFKERIRLLFLGRIYVKVLTFGNPVQPINVQIDNYVD